LASRRIDRDVAPTVRSLGGRGGPISHDAERDVALPWIEQGIRLMNNYIAARTLAPPPLSVDWYHGII
jgi:hypothetical protein